MMWIPPATTGSTTCSTFSGRPSCSSTCWRGWRTTSRGRGRTREGPCPPADWHTGATVSLATWLNTWGGLCHDASGLGDFPNWIRTSPDIFFDLIDRDGDDVISEEELEDFFVRFLGMKDHVRERVKNLHHEINLVCEGGNHCVVNLRCTLWASFAFRFSAVRQL